MKVGMNMKKYRIMIIRVRILNLDIKSNNVETLFNNEKTTSL